MDKFIITRDQLKRILELHPGLMGIIQDVQKQSITDDDNCPLCDASLERRWHKITPVLIHALVKAYKVVSERGRNYFNKKDLDLDHNEYGNFQKLRYHALIAKYKENGEWHKGDWLLTRRCGQFLRGEIQIPKRVQTFRNKVVNHSSEMTNLRQVIKSDEYVQTDFRGEYFDQTDFISDD